MAYSNEYLEFNATGSSRGRIGKYVSGDNTTAEIVADDFFTDAYTAGEVVEDDIIFAKGSDNTWKFGAVWDDSGTAKLRAIASV